MERGMMESYRRTFDFVKKNILTILVMCLVLFGISIGITILYQFFMFIINFLILFFAVFIGVGIALILEGGGIAVLGIFLFAMGCILALITIGAYIGSIVFLGSLGMGLQILISEILIKLKHGVKIIWKEEMNYINTSWRSILKKGSRLFITYLAVAIPFILIFILILTGIISMLVYSAAKAPESSPVTAVSLILMIFTCTVFIISFLIFVPILMYLVESAAVRVAEGKKSGMAFRYGFKDIRHNRRGVWYYILGTFLLFLASILFFPIAFIVQPLIPILTKAFFITNRDMFYD
jgi:hypothetical protein